MIMAGASAAIGRFFHWLGTPIRATRALFPFTYDGRQTLIYLMCAGSAPVLTLAVMHILEVLAAAEQWNGYREISRIVGYALLISVCAFSMFVAFRSLSLGGKDGLLNLSSKDSPPPPDPVQAARAVESDVREAAAAAVEKVEAITTPASPPKPDDPTIPDYAKP